MRANIFTSGKIYGRWTLLSSDYTTKYFGKNNRPVRCYLCKCECGKEKLVRGDYLLRGTSKSCGCLRSDRAREKGKSQRTEDSYHNLIYGECKRSSKYRGIDFNLTKSQHRDIITKPCKYCGQKPFIRENVRCGIPFPHLGIDRIDNTIGYNIENCVPCCSICNSMKMDHSLEDFYNHIIKIIRHTNI